MKIGVYIGLTSFIVPFDSLNYKVIKQKLNKCKIVGSRCSNTEQSPQRNKNVEESLPEFKPGTSVPNTHILILADHLT